MSMLRRLSFGAFAIVAPLLAPAAAVAGEGISPPLPVRIVTFNVREGIGADNTPAYEATGDFITYLDVDGAGPNMGLNPDIVALQECRSVSNLNTFRDEFLPNYVLYRVTSVDAGGNFNAMFIRPDWTVVDFDVITSPGPRNFLRLHIDIPGTVDLLTVYTAHFKAFGDSGSQATRTAEADLMGQLIYEDLTLGLDLDDNGSRETPPGRVVLTGDLNSNNNADGTIDGVFTHSVLGVPTGVLNLPVESLAGALSGGSPQISTFNSGSRLDYQCLDATLAAPFDADQNGSFSQTEINSMGFVYISSDDAGQMASGNSSAVFNASDHRPVVFDILMEREPGSFFDTRDVDQNNVIDLEDLQLWETLFAQGTAPDVDGDFVIDLEDRDLIREKVRENEGADIETR